MSTSNGVSLAPGAADRLRQRLDDPATAAALNEILDRLDVIALSVNSLDGLLRRSDVIIESARDSVNDLRQTAPKDLDLEKTLTQLGQSLPAVLESLPELSRSLPQLTRLAARLNEPETSAAIDTVLDNAAVLALAAQSADGLLKRSDVIIENVAGSVRDVVGSDSAANVATFRKFRRAIKPGGTLLVNDFVLRDDRTGHPFAMMFAAQMVLASKEGFAWRESDYRAWLAEAGFSSVEFVATPTPATIVLAR